MDVKKLLCDVLSQLSSFSFEEFKQSLKVSLHCILGQLQNVDSVELMQKSSADCLEMTVTILKDVPRLDLVHKLQADVNLRNKETIDIQRVISETLKDLTHVELNKFTSALQIELSQIWKQRLDNADLSKVIELMVTVFSQDPLVLTKKVLVKMSMMNKCLYLTPPTEDISDVKVLISKTLTPREFIQFKHHLEIYLTHISVKQLETTNMDNIVALMEINSYQNCVEMTEKVLKRMDRPDLVDMSQSRAEEHIGRQTRHLLLEYKDAHVSNQGSHGSGGTVEHQGGRIFTEESRGSGGAAGNIAFGKIRRIKTPRFTSTTPLFKKWFAMQSAITEALLKTLRGLSHVQLQSFHQKVGLHSSPTVKMNPEQTVFEIVLQYGTQSVHKVTDVFVDMGLTEQAQTLMNSASEPVTEQYDSFWSYSERNRDHSSFWSQLSRIAVVKALLLDTVHDLSHRELKHFQWFVQFTCLQMGLSWRHLDWERQTQEFKTIATSSPPLTAREACRAMISAVVTRHGAQSVSVMKAVGQRRNMDSDDLVSRMYCLIPPTYIRADHGFYSDKTSSEFSWFAPEKAVFESKVKQMEDVITTLLETLGHLNVKELSDLKQTLKTGPYHAPPWYRLSDVEMSSLVFYIVQTYGLKSVEITKSLLTSIGRTDLGQIQIKDSSNEHLSDFWLTELIYKVSEMAVGNELIEESLNQMSGEELKLFKKLFLLKNILHMASLMDLRLWASANAAETGTLLLHTYGWEAVEMTNEILMDMNRKHLTLQLQSSRLFFYGRSSENVAEVEDLRGTLCKLLSHVEIDTFKRRLQVTYFHCGLEWIPDTVLQGTCDAEGLADLIIEICGQKSIEVIENVLYHMNRTDLLKPVKSGHWSQVSLQCESFNYDDTKDSKSFHQPLPKKASAAKEKLQDILQELTDCSEMQSLEKHLQTLCENNLSRRFVKIYTRMYPGVNELVELMKAVYGERRCVKMIKAVLTKMEDMSKPSSSASASSALTESVEPKSCTNIMDTWTKLEPEVNEIDGDNRSTYRLQSDAGSFECSVSRLRWRCEEQVSFEYKFGSWEEHMERVEALQYRPAGPLIDLTVRSGRLDVVYLPHWICIDDPKIEKNLAVLHTDDCGDTVESVAEVTSSHVKLCEPVFSPRAVMVKLGLPVKIYCSVLIYKTNTAFLTLHVYLIPCDPGLKESMDRQELKYGYSIIQKPRPDYSLKVRDRFLLIADKETVEITPEKLKLRYQNQPNFFEVYCKKPDFDFRLELRKETEHVPVWSCTIRQDDYTEGAEGVSNAQGSHFVDRFRTKLIQRVTNTEEILDDMLQEKIINQEVYEKIIKLNTAQNKMRELYNGPLKSSGEKVKDIFYKILKTKERYLCADLEDS